MNILFKNLVYDPFMKQFIESTIIMLSIILFVGCVTLLKLYPRGTKVLRV